MNDFKKRIGKGEKLVDKIISELKKRGTMYILSGYENLFASKGAIKTIITNSDTTSFFVRHYPDLTLTYPKKTILLEVKNSSGIEKNCYLNYLKLMKNMGLVVYLFLKNHKICSIENLIFKPANELDPISGLKIPITDGIWREPRLLAKWQYEVYLRAYRDAKKYTSGCSFAFIDFDKTKYVKRGSIFNGDFCEVT